MIKAYGWNADIMIRLRDYRAYRNVPNPMQSEPYLNQTQPKLNLNPTKPKHNLNQTQLNQNQTQPTST